MPDKSMRNKRINEKTLPNRIVKHKSKRRHYPLPYLAVLAVPIIVVIVIVCIFALVPFADRESYVDAPSTPEGTDVATPTGLYTEPSFELNSAPVATVSATATPDPNAIRYLDEREIDGLIKSNDYESEGQKQLVNAATSLVGKVNYFWGGKSDSVGADPEWGQLRPVKSEGHETSGTQQPYGLDCSGYVNWCFIQLCRKLELSPEQIIEIIGDGTWNQWNNSAEINKAELRIGDLAFVNSYPTKLGNHVGICVGFESSGEPLIAQCSYTMNNVVVSTCGNEFKYFRRPKIEII